MNLGKDKEGVSSIGMHVIHEPSAFISTYDVHVPGVKLETYGHLSMFSRTNITIKISLYVRFIS